MAARDEWIAEITQKIRSATPIYTDEPILFTANQMQNYLPQKCREMRHLAFQSGHRSLTSAEIFYKQGKFMEDYEDDCPFSGEFVRYFPTYESMSDRQLRGYFTWRTYVRHGEIEKTSLSFVYVYIYELLALIGASDALDALRKLRDFYAAYQKLDMQINRYMEVWLRDFVIYYDLDPSLLGETSDAQFDQSLSVLRAWKEADDDALFGAIGVLSSYQITRSPFYRLEPQKVQQTLCGVFRALSDYYEKHRKYSLTEAYFGRLYTTPYTMFYSAIFFRQHAQADRTYRVSELCTFSCKDDKWSCTRVWGKRGKNAELGAVVRAVDAVLRRHYSFAHLLKTDSVPKYLQKIITDTIHDVQEQQNMRAAREVKIDFSKLQGIRDDAEVTRERLIVEEEPGPTEQAESEPTRMEENALGLDRVECAVLRGLLLRQNIDDIICKSGKMLSVIVDSINEKCFDCFGDTVLVMDTEMPEVLKDYEEELKGMLL